MRRSIYHGWGADSRSRNLDDGDCLIIALIADEENPELQNCNRLNYQMKELNKTFDLSFIITYTITIYAKQTRGYTQIELATCLLKNISGTTELG